MFSNIHLYFKILLIYILKHKNIYIYIYENIYIVKHKHILHGIYLSNVGLLCLDENLNAGNRFSPKNTR